MKPRLLDLFCGAGGAAMGYHEAGFDVIGVDVVRQPHYPFEFWWADALDLLRWWGAPMRDFQAVHASPPCQAYSDLGARHGRAGYADHVATTRRLLTQAGVPYVIENVVGAPLHDPTLLCGAAFGLGADCEDGRWRHLRRHRLFETNWPLTAPACACDGSEPVGVYGAGGAQHQTVHTGGVNRGYMASAGEARAALGITWVAKPGLAQAIPPAYTRHIGAQLLSHLAGPRPAAAAGIVVSPLTPQEAT